MLRDQAIALASWGAALLAAVGGPRAAFGVDYPEAGTHNTRTTAMPVAFPGGMLPGDTITGVTTGQSGTGTTAPDYYTIKIAPEPSLGIHRYRLQLSTGGTQGHVLSMPGWGQNSSGQISVGTSNVWLVAGEAGTTPPRFIQWYGFGKGESVNAYVSGATSTTQPYVLTLQKDAVAPAWASTVFRAGSVTVAAAGAADTELWIYDANFDPVPGAGNDQNTIASGGAGVGNAAAVRRTLAAGTYYAAVGLNNLSNDQASPPDDARRTGWVMEHPGAVASGATASLGAVFPADASIIIGDGTSSESVPATLSGPYEVSFVRFVVAGQPMTASGAVSAPSASPGGPPVLVTVQVTPSVGADNTVLGVSLDLRDVGGAAAAPARDDGVDGDAAAGDGVYSLLVTVGSAVLPGPRTMVYKAVDASGRTASGPIAVTVDPVPPPNGDCGSAAVLSDAALPYSVTTSIYQAPGGPGPCTPFANNSLWYVYTPAADGFLQLSESGPRDVSWAVREGGCAGTLVTCDPADAGVSAVVRAGRAYAVQVYAPGPASAEPTDTYALSINFAPMPAPPANDVCAAATDLTASVFPLVVTVPAGGAGPDDPVPCNTVSGSPAPAAYNGVWFKYTATQDVLLQVAETDNATSGVFAVFESCGGPLFGCRALGPGGTGVNSHATVPLPGAPGGRIYYILVARGQQGSATADYDLSIRVLPNPLPNRSCEGAVDIAAVPFTDAPTKVFAHAGPPTSCSAVNRYATWYRYTPARDSTVAFDQHASGGTIVFTGHCGALQEFWCDPVFSPADTNVRLRLQGGVTYHFMVYRDSATEPGNDNQHRFTLADAGVLPPPPPNDLCSAARVIPAAPFEDEVFHAGATDDYLVGCLLPTDTVYVPHLTPPTNQLCGVWYRYDNGPDPATGSARLIQPPTAPPGHATLAVYSVSCPAGDYQELACSIKPDSDAQVVFSMQPSTTYYILAACGTQNVNRRPMSDERLTLRFDVVPAAPPPPAHSTCGGAMAVAQLPFRHVVHAADLAADPTGAPCNTGGAGSAVRSAHWYSYTAGPNDVGYAVFSEEGPVDAVIAVYGGCPAPGGAALRCATTVRAGKGEQGVVQLTPGTTYYFLLGRKGAEPAAPGDYFDFRLSAAAAPTHDGCAGAREIPAFPYHDVVPMAGLTSDPIPAGACTAGPVGNAVWYRFTARDSFLLWPKEHGPNEGFRRYLLYKVNPASPCNQSQWTLAGCTTNWLGASVWEIEQTPAPMQVVAGGTYYLLVGQSTPPASANLQFFALDVDTLGSDVGACRSGGSAALSTRQNCQGTFTPGAAPRCPADHNGQGSVELLDIFAFLADWFAGNPSADFNGANGVDLLDIFAFLEAWFGGC